MPFLDADASSLGTDGLSAIRTLARAGLGVPEADFWLACLLVVQLPDSPLFANFQRVSGLERDAEYVILETIIAGRKAAKSSPWQGMIDWRKVPATKGELPARVRSLSL